MNIGFAALFALMLVLPGIGFIVGVNFADKNVREIVFRNAPAEIGYVISISMLVHLGFVLVARYGLVADAGGNFNAATLALRYTSATLHPETLTEPDAGLLLIKALSYFLITFVVGGLAGAATGWFVRAGYLDALAKHKWMLQFVGARASDVVYAQVLLAPSFPLETTEKGMTRTDGGPTEIVRKRQHAIKLEGFVSDPFFDSTGKLLYLVFKRVVEAAIPLDEPPFLNTEQRLTAEIGPVKPARATDQLVVEGSQVAFARYQRVPGRIFNDATVDELARYVRTDMQKPAPAPAPLQ